MQSIMVRKHGCGNVRTACCVKSALWKQAENRKQGQATKLQILTLVTHFLKSLPHVSPIAFPNATNICGPNT